MSRPGVGNPGNKGNKNARRPSAYEEVRNAIWHQRAWEQDSLLPALTAKIESGSYSVRDMFLFKALGGNERVLSIFANKLLPDLVDMTSKGEKLNQILTVNYLPPQDDTHD